jgi:hypothetical protein
MNALFKLALKGSALGAFALMTTTVGCSDSNKDETTGAAGMDGGGSSNNNQAGSGTGPAGSDGGGTTPVAMGGGDAGGAPAVVEGGAPAVIEGGAPAGGAGGAAAGVAVAKFCNDLTFGTEANPMDTTMVLEVGEGADKVTFTATTGECAPADGDACTMIPLGADVPIALYDADDLTTVIFDGTIENLAGDNTVFYTDLSQDAEPAPVVAAFSTGEGTACEDVTYAQVYAP